MVKTEWSNGQLSKVDGKHAVCTRCKNLAYYHGHEWPFAVSEGSGWTPCEGFQHPLQPIRPPPEPQQRYGISQQMIARFPGVCWNCKGKLRPEIDSIVPVLSARTLKGGNPWIHLGCVKANGTHRLAPEVNQQPPVEASRFLFDPPPVSQRQIDVVGRNLEAVLKALAANPAVAYALVPADTVDGESVVVTEAIVPNLQQEEAHV